MAQTKPKKVYAAESMRLAGKSTTSASPDEAAAARHDEILAAISELRQIMSRLGPGRAGAAPEKGAPAQTAEAASRPEAPGPDVGALRQELESVRNAIIDTKKEIAAVRHPAAPSDRLLVATDELDAVVAATEQATQSILQTAETLDEMADRIKQASSDDFISKTADEMRELIIKVFEACNFQDITGQRITKVVTTVKYIEDRVNKMIAIWGPESFAEIELPEAPSKDPDHDLLSGPQLGDEGVSQEDIDKLFG